MSTPPSNSLPSSNKNTPFTSFNDYPAPLISAPLQPSDLHSQHKQQLPSAAPTSLDPAAPKKRRSHASLSACCKICRLRKVKCSGRPTVGSKCSNCLRLDLDCSFVDASESPLDIAASRKTPSRSHTEAGTARRRAQRACTNCHAHKTKCSSDLPRCKRCDVNNLTCEYVAAKRKFTSAPIQVAALDNPPARKDEPGDDSTASSDQASSGDGKDGPAAAAHEDQVPNNAGVKGPNAPGSPDMPSEALNKRVRDMADWENRSILLNQDFIRPHFDAFFKNLAHLPCLSFFHQATLYHDLEHGRISPSLAAAICSVTAFFLLPLPACIDFAINCCRQVEFQLFRNVGSLHESHTFLYALAIVHNLMLGKSAKCWQIVALASRNMVGLQLNWDSPVGGSRQRPFVEEECLRRVTWHLFHMDRLCADGFEAYICCRESDMKIRLPCNQEAFDKGISVGAERLVRRKTDETMPPMSPQGYCLRLINLRHHILGLTKRLYGATAKLHGVKDEASDVMSEVQCLQKEITNLQKSLPADLQLTEPNIRHWAGSPEEQSFVYIHSWICTLHIELYQFALPGLEETGSRELLRKLPGDFTTKCQKQATAWAITAGRFWQRLAQESVEARHPLAPTHLGDIFMTPCIQRTVRTLMTATRNNLYHDLANHSTAPLGREVLDSRGLTALIRDVLAYITPLAGCIKSMGLQLEELRAFVDEFEREMGPVSIQQQQQQKQQQQKQQKQQQQQQQQAILPVIPASSGHDSNLPTLPGTTYMLEPPAGAFDIPMRANHIVPPIDLHALHPPMPHVTTNMVISGWPPRIPPDPVYTDFYGHKNRTPDHDAEFFPPGMPLILADARGMLSSTWHYIGGGQQEMDGFGIANGVGMTVSGSGNVGGSTGVEALASDRSDEVALMYMQQLNHGRIPEPAQTHIQAAATTNAVTTTAMGSFVMSPGAPPSGYPVGYTGYSPV